MSETRGHRWFKGSTHDQLAGEFNLRRDNLGRGCVMVEVAQLTPEAIVEALDGGNFYASTEIIFTKFKVNQKELSTQIQQASDFKYTTLFIGKGGEVLQKVHGNDARYQFDGHELYVRAKVFSSNGGWAWPRPVFTADFLR